MGTYPQEFKDQMVELHRQGRAFIDLSREFNVSATSIANWARSAERREAYAATRRTRRQRQATAQRGETRRGEPVEAVRDVKDEGSVESEPVESDRVRIARLERELAAKTEEVEILGKALAFFVLRSPR